MCRKLPTTPELTISISSNIAKCMCATTMITVFRLVGLFFVFLQKDYTLYNYITCHHVILATLSRVTN